jgi:DNA-directed RNA polymerase specialized sigma24 family protein
VKVSQKDRRPLDRFYAAIGVGRVTGPYEHDIHTWQVGGNSGARRALDLLWPYLSQPKREQAEAAMATIAARPELVRDTRKRTILSLQAQGLSLSEIAEAVGRSPRTIRYHLREHAGGR